MCHPVVFAEIGNVRRRFVGFFANYDTYFIELEGNNYNRKIYYEVKTSNNSTHHYSTFLDTTTGYWSYYFDSILLDSFSDVNNLWLNINANRANISGEILNEYDDMPGTINDPCFIYNCFVTTNTVWGTLHINFTNPDIDTSATELLEWMFQIVSPDTLSIWDVNPHP